MFDRDAFISYVGAASGTTYASGLARIESLYGKSIDAEYDKDKCKSLIAMLDELKANQTEGSAELGNLRNRISCVKRYIQFKESGGAERLRIVDELRACLKNVPLGTVLTRQEIIEMLVNAYGANPASVIPSDYCYNMTNKGKSGNVNFFLSVGTGEYEYVGESYAGMGISEVIARFKQSFSQIWEDEKYKWEAVKHYKRTWDINATDFASMLSNAFGLADNLLAGGMYYPYKMICAFAQQDPEAVRALFKMLYDEKIPLEKRYKDFRSGCDKCLADYKAAQPDRDKALNHYQDLRAVSVYLSFEYPEEYFLYKYKMYAQFKDLIGFPEEKGKNRSEIWKLESFDRMCGDVLSAVKNDSELLSMVKANLTDDCYDDSAYHLLTQTVIYIGSSYTPETSKAQPAISADDVTEPDTPEIQAYDSEKTDIGLNTILYGPPGTGKTYCSAIYAVAIIENKPLNTVSSEPYSEVFERYNEYKDQGLIEFTTFHQSYGYEEFIEGIRPVMSRDDDDNTEIEYELASGVFKSFCEKAGQSVLSEDEDFGFNADPSVWKVSLDGTGDNKVRSECMDKGHIRIGWDDYGEVITGETDFKIGGKPILNAFINKMRIGDIVLSCYSSTTIDAIGVVTGDYEWHGEYERLRRLRPVRWLVKGIREDITGINNGANMTLSTVYRLNVSVNDVLDIVRKYVKPSYRTAAKKPANHVFIIDEINRGNISKILGELITLLEPTKRLGQSEALTARLPYSKKLFGVSDNVYILGTMNTADRSIATIDTALRRRFQFREMMPSAQALEGISVEDVRISELLSRMNEKISVLYDREHTVGHAYFMPLKESPTIEVLASIFANKIIPLLQEYFYDDYEKIRLVLGDNNKTDESIQFITAKSVNYAELFGNTDMSFDDGFRYEVNKAAFDNLEAYRSI